MLSTAARALALAAAGAALAASSSPKSDEPAAEASNVRARPVSEPTRSPDRPVEIKAADDLGHSIASTVIEWCNPRGTSNFWRNNMTVEVTDCGKGCANVRVEHDRKDDLLQGHTLHYMVKMKRSGATITPQKDISAKACRALDAEPLVDGVAYPLSVDSAR